MGTSRMRVQRYAMNVLRAKRATISPRNGREAARTGTGIRKP
jgi:hypothetical protein